MVEIRRDKGSVVIRSGGLARWYSGTARDRESRRREGMCMLDKCEVLLTVHTSCRGSRNLDGMGAWNLSCILQEKLSDVIIEREFPGGRHSVTGKKVETDHIAASRQQLSCSRLIHKKTSQTATKLKTLYGEEAV